VSTSHNDVTLLDGKGSTDCEILIALHTALASAQARRFFVFPKLYANSQNLYLFTFFLYITWTNVRINLLFAILYIKLLVHLHIIDMFTEMSGGHLVGNVSMAALVMGQHCVGQCCPLWDKMCQWQGWSSWDQCNARYCWASA